MATEVVDVVLVFGKTKIPVRVSGEDGCRPTVYNLSLSVLEHTNIKPQAQKLIYRGRTLFKTFDPEEFNLKKPLSSLGVKNGDRIMVFGKPSVPDEGKHEDSEADAKEAALMKMLDQHQAKIDDICKLCGDMVDKISAQSGPLEECKKNKKWFLAQSEFSMQELTRLDATPGDLSQRQEYKTRRKALVNKLLENISLCDNQVSKLSDSIQKLERTSR